MTKKYKVKMTESQLEKFKLYLKEHKTTKTKKKMVEDVEENDEGDIESSLNDMYQELVDYGVATEKEIDLVTNINGFNKETLLDILYARTGYRDFEDLK